MTQLVLHYHPLSSYCHKVLIALDELGIEVDRRLLNPGDPDERAAWLALWPLGKMPLLIDGGQVVPEASIIIEHLQRHHGHEDRRLIPADADAALDVRLWDRVFDLHVMTPMQALTADLMRPEPERDARTVAKARGDLQAAYRLIDARLGSHAWMAGREFSLADCAAAPALFYAVTYVPIPEAHERLAAYFERLLQRPSVARTIDQARPYFGLFPNRAGLAPRFLNPAAR